jgi:hypothetical protein
MSEPASRQRILRAKSLRLAVRLGLVVFPIDSIGFLEGLSRKGFEILAKIPPPSQIPFRAQVGIGGTVARKGNSFVDINAEKEVLGVTGLSIEEAMATFADVSDVTKSDFGVDIEKDSRFFEILATFESDSDRSPIESVSRTLAESKLLSEVGEVLGEAVSPFSVRLVSKGRVPNQEEWVDITVEPSPVKPNRTYLISLIYRSAQKKNVWSFSKDLVSRISRVIDAVEKAQ